MVEQVFWLVGNISGEGKAFRDKIVGETSILEIIERLLKTGKISKTLLRTMCWVNSNISRHKGMSMEELG